MIYELNRCSSYIISLCTNKGSKPVKLSNESQNILVLQDSEGITSELDNDSPEITLSLTLLPLIGD